MDLAKCLLAMFLCFQFFFFELAIFLGEFEEHVFYLAAFVVSAVWTHEVRQNSLSTPWARLEFWGLEKNMHSPLSLPGF